MQESELGTHSGARGASSSTTWHQSLVGLFVFFFFPQFHMKRDKGKKKLQQFQCNETKLQEDLYIHNEQV